MLGFKLRGSVEHLAGALEETGGEGAVARLHQIGVDPEIGRQVNVGVPLLHRRVVIQFAGTLS